MAEVFLRGSQGPGLGLRATTRWTFTYRLYVADDYPDPDRRQSPHGDLVCRVGEQYFPAVVSAVTAAHVTYRALGFLTSPPEDADRGVFGFVHPATLSFTPLTDIYTENFNG